eukprot:CAMPEP_0179422808 /NCGR_PEP_ID=MMETSP0799-20121207/10652_1 /TAXON_ID=46947 /ORGANISM="Geminigera cryophila, Strain CCMP2564" /LENGTH=350 /DNA_ID=CAMNT_0021197017 /DNA_START=140 /DNA_END=1192 /DNA_ORIENTATION=+
MVEPQLDGAIEVIPGRLYWAMYNETPRDTQTIHFVNTTNRFVYEPFYRDFGPLNLSQLYRYCHYMHEKLKAKPGMKICHWSPNDGSHAANSVWLLGGYMIMMMGKNGDEAWAPYRMVHPKTFEPFRDASQGPCPYKCTIEHCFKGLYRANCDGFWDFTTFDPDEYEYYEKVENGDYNVITPKFIAFSGPSAKKTEIFPGVHSKVCADYFDLWRKHKVTAIVRLNKKIYDRQDFLRAGFNHYDMYFLDGSVPTPEIAEKFIEVCEQERGCIAVHCKAGLGRTGTLIGLYIMKHYGWTAEEFIAWNRIVRPGSVIGPQQQFLQTWQSRMWAAGDKMRRDKGLVVKAQPAAGR